MRGTGAGAAPRRLLVINPNSNPQVTARIADVAGRLVMPPVDIRVANPPDGPFSIETAADRAVAEPKVVELVQAACLGGGHGFVLACFDDIGVVQARRMAPGPVVDACEAGIAVARTLSERFSIVTTVAGAVGRIERLVGRFGASGSCTVRAAGIGVADAASGIGEEKLDAAIRKALAADGASAIVLGSGGLAGRGEELSERFGVPVVDGVAAAISLCQSILYLGLTCAWPATSPRVLQR